MMIEGIIIFLGLCLVKVGLVRIGWIEPVYGNPEEIIVQEIDVDKIERWDKLVVGESEIILNGEGIEMEPGSKTTFHKEDDGVWYIERER